MGDQSLGDFNLAKKVKASIEKVAKDKVEQLRPALRTAIVDSIHTVEKYCMVTYVGEVLSVKVPYNNVAPSFVGQFVRIGGPANDRRIEEVLGITDSEDRLALLEKRCARLELQAYAYAMPTAPFNSTAGVPKAPINQIIGTPKNIDVDSLGQFTVSIPGHYEYNVRFQTDDYRDTVVDIYVVHVPFGEAPYDYDRGTNVYLWGSGEYTAEGQIIAHGIIHLNEGDMMYVNVGSNRDVTIHAYGTKFALKLFDPDIIEE